MDAADPWVTQKDGYYYFTATLNPDQGLSIWRSRTLTNLDHGDKKLIWSAPPTGPTSHGIWAPELHFLQNHWYLYFTATDGPDNHHRMFVAEAKTNDPLGPYNDPIRLDPELDHYAIDGSVLTMPDGRLYCLYTTGSLWIAPMTTPMHVNGSQRIEICHATEPWERGWVEAPEELQHKGKIFLTYSAGHSGTPNYALGLLTLTGTDPLNAANWTKTKNPVFTPYFGWDGAVYCVGHNGFATSPDGTENWIIYHAKDWRTDERKDQGFNGRTTRMQRFTWNKDGSPHFGHPIPTGIAIPAPSGE
ncbi:MAG TPA: glycoside hydrolase family 43 protein, partial [Tepidisphaeraceae bacterium]|jgi:GH43 family beta-xylosidase|nr:glycoside hydrolase family 43 protein [Tepidisphaeraceae bacterium]